MKIKFGSLVVAGRGKIGGHVASRNRAGAYLRTKVTPVNPQSVAQGIVRNFFTAVTQAWRGLSDAQRLAWRNAVSNFVGTDIFGDAKTLTGHQLHQRINNYLLFISESVLTVPPLPTEIPAFSSLSAVISNGADTLLATFADPIAVTEKVIVSATPALSAGKNFVKSEFRSIGVKDSTFVTGADLMTEWKAIFGTTPAVGTKIFVRMQQVNIATGLPGASIVASAIVVA